MESIQFNTWCYLLVQFFVNNLMSLQLGWILTAHLLSYYQEQL